MDLKTLTLKSILIIFNSLNIISAIIHVIVILVTDDSENKGSGMLLNYIFMIMSAACCGAAVMESYILLIIIANVFLSKVVITIVLGAYKTPPIHIYTFFCIILHSIITCLAYYMAQKIQQSKINNLISKYTGVAVIPLNPPPHVRSDVI
ncbi:uncharacterized protein ACRADG_010602 [Cochliomyia hominivorax]